MFPFTVRYSRKFNKKISLFQGEEIMSYIKDFILKRKGEDIVIEGNKLSFNVGFLTYSWLYNVLVPLNGGTFNLEFNDEGCLLKYEFSTYKLFIYNAAISLVVGITSYNFYILLFVFLIMSLGWWLTTLIRQSLMLGEIVFDIEVQIIEKKEKESNNSLSDNSDYRLPGAVDWTPEDGEWKREGG